MPRQGRAMAEKNAGDIDLSRPAPLSVSIVITAYNHERYIAEALESVLTQDLVPREIILVDDGSTDDTFRIAHGYEARGVTIIQRENGGPSSAFNQGAARATGDVLVFFSGDDVLMAGSIRQRVEVLASAQHDIVCSVPEWIGSDGRKLSQREHPAHFPPFGAPTPTEMFAKLYYDGNFICAPSVAMTRDCWLETGELDSGFWQLQDYDYWLRACAKNKRFFCLPEPCVYYRWHGKNLSERNTLKSVYEMETIWLEAPRYLEQEMLMDLVFGGAFSTFETPLTPDDLRMFVRRKHQNNIVKQHARNELQQAFRSPEAAARLAAGVF